MLLRREPNPNVRYRDRQRLPWWVPPTALLVGAGFIAAIFGVDALVSGDRGSTGWTIFAMADLGVPLALATFWSRAKIEIDDHSLRVGSSEVLLDAIESIRVIRGREVDHARRRAVSPTIGASLPVSMITGARSRAGMRASIWQREAVLLEAPTDTSPLWVVGTQHPEELAAALADAVRDARALSGLPPPVVAAPR